MRRVLQYGLGLPAALICAHTATLILGQLINYFPCWLPLATCRDPRFTGLFDSILLAPRIYGHARALEDHAIGYIPPFIGIACVALMMRPAFLPNRLLLRLLLVATVGLTIGLIYGIVLYYLYNQPTPFDFTAFWNGTAPLYVLGWPPIEAFDDTALFGVLASLLIWTIKSERHEV